MLFRSQGIWHYFTAVSRLDPSADYILITTPSALPALAEGFGAERVTAVLLEAGDGNRLRRCMDREEVQPRPDYAELCRRYLSDEEDFAAPLCPAVTRWIRIDADRSPEDCLEQLRRGLAAQGRSLEK